MERLIDFDSTVLAIKSSSKRRFCKSLANADLVGLKKKIGIIQAF